MESGRNFVSNGVQFASNK